MAVVGGRQCVGRWPGGCLENEDCEIVVVGSGGGTLGACPVFDTEGSDCVTMPNGSHHSLGECPAGVWLSLGENVGWHSDEFAQGYTGGNGLPYKEHSAGGGLQLCFA
eukprot:SAG11_NODE_309_length_10941_cov_5.580520_5_plen_108_part_00